MDEKKSQIQMDSYQLMMAENIFNHLGLTLDRHHVVEALNNPESKYFALVKLPMLSALNGLILGQIESYKLFCQKRLSDYVILTNPPNEVQSQPEFQDKIPEDIMFQKQVLQTLQQQIRDLSQQHYDVLASMYAYLKNIIQVQVMQHPDIAWDKQAEFLQVTQEFEEKINQIKLILLNIREESEELAREITLVVAQKNDFALEPKEQEVEKMDLKFYHRLGIEANEFKEP